MAIGLRPLREEDGARVLAWRNAPHVAEHMFAEGAIGEAAHARWLDKVLRAEAEQYWIIVLDGLPVGLANVVGIDRHNRRADWGFYIGEPSARGSGVGRAALYLVIEQAFGAYALHRLTCSALAVNESAWRLYESMGFMREGHLQDHIRKDGRYHDVLLFGLMADGWAAKRPKVEARLRETGIEPSDLYVGGA
jgi:UDP-4-amino-4,6-dideoxy-N-acetyl-beta-L-altrosamine N-acetyltransferase